MGIIRKFSDSEYWDGIYEANYSKYKLETKEYFLQSYITKCFWILCNKYLPKEEGLKILEVGSAPGLNLVQFNKYFGYEPFGIDYSVKGCEINRKVFSSNGLNRSNIIYDDLFSDSFQEENHEKFDIVCSFGFIEHFENFHHVLDAHLNLLKPGGYLLTSIPNMNGINLDLINFFQRKEVIEIHNMNIMELENFRAIFDEKNLETLYCDYYGSFNIGLINYQKQTLIKDISFFLISWFNLMLQYLVFPLLSKIHRIEGRKMSAHLIYFGRKFLKDR